MRYAGVWCSFGCGVDAMLHASPVPKPEAPRCNLQTKFPQPSYSLSHSLLPSLVHNTRSVRLPLLQQRLALPLRDIKRVDVAAGLDAEAAARSPGGGAAHRGDVDVLSRVELEGGLGAVDLEVDARGRVVGGDEARQGLAAGVERDGRGGRVVEDEDVVYVWLGGAQREGLLALELGEGGWLGCGRDAAVVEGEVRVCY